MKAFGFNVLKGHPLSILSVSNVVNLRPYAALVAPGNALSVAAGRLSFTFALGEFCFFFKYNLGLILWVFYCFWGRKVAVVFSWVCFGPIWLGECFWVFFFFPAVFGGHMVVVERE